MTEESQGELVARLRHELGIASAYASQLREMIFDARCEDDISEEEFNILVTELDTWLRHWRENGTLRRV
jgi:hypothetical protein